MKKVNMRFVVSILGAISFIFLIVISFTSCGSSVIDDLCPNCTETEVRNSDFILVTNQEGESNVFSKSKEKFILSKWYPAKFAEGVFYDDITFVVDGKEVMVSESNYELISDDYLLGKNKPEKNKEGIEEKETPTEWPCNQCNTWFTHRGYKINDAGVCKQLEEPYQGFQCSCECAWKVKNDFDKAVDDALNY